MLKNKNDIHKNEVQDIRWSDELPRVHHIKSKLTNHFYKLLWSSESFELKYNIGFGIPIDFPSQRKKSVHKQENGLLWSSESFEGKYNIWFGIPIEYPSLDIKINLGFYIFTSAAFMPFSWA